MYLERIEITGYRGISRLTVNFNNQTVLIGENSWGKSSLLRLLWCVLGNGEVPYEFVEDDFRKEVSDYQFERYDEEKQTKYLHEKDISVVLVFREVVLGAALKDSRLQRLYPAWVRCRDSYSRVFYYLHGHMNCNGSVFTDHSFLDANGDLLNQHVSMMKQVVSLLALNPLFRIRDRRRGNHGLDFGGDADNTFRREQDYGSESTGYQNGFDNGDSEDYDYSGDDVSETSFNTAGADDVGRKNQVFGRKSGQQKALEHIRQKLPKFLKSMIVSDGENVADTLLSENLDAINTLLEHYFSIVPPLSRTARGNKGRKTGRDIQDIVLRPVSNEAFGSVSKLLNHSGKRSIKIILSLIVASFVDDLEGRKIDSQARPIVVFEDIESRLHPTVLMNIWNLVDLMPIQKIVTTNSGDLLSAVALSDIRRMCKTVSSVECRFIDEKKFNSDEMRRIAFHIRINRPMSLFARAWIFVEGETEIWLLNEFAAILGIGLQAEGIRLVEYAQCGAGPLIKLANQLGISWHLLADGDEAGVKYARSAGNGDSDDCVTLLPSVDIEHFLYDFGFADVYRQNCGVSSTHNLSRNKIIDMAIRRKSKPGMALAVVDEARRRGKRSIPHLFQKILVKVKSEANNRH
ncbi:MAG: DUF2813 domain-containing protein [Ruminobacter sp.]|jgi:putative ATP-dependent endonuclease of OLD family|uniref:DUF2813 domain-containing protein n=1 Tax=Ruminobacter sp. TaxID=2774296 RepID=UPI00258019BE|nr:DUF2813 domain-containing protein [Ruminobacter sp.]MBQ3776210.1 DUF2813 domain-containing protein [Ruminobacter sp.]